MLRPVRSPFPSASGGLRALECVRERRLSARRCRLGTSFSRSSFPPVAMSRRWRRLRGIRSCPARPRPVGALLRRRRRACGGRSPCVGDLYRSWSAAARHPPWRRPFRLLPCSAGVLPRRLQRSWDIFCKDAAAAVGLTDGWRVDRARVPPMMVGGKLWSKVVGAWGAAPVDGLSGMPLSRPFG